MPGRTWVIAPDSESLRRRWDALIREHNPERRERLLRPHLARGEPGDRHTAKVPSESLHGHEARMMSVASDPGPVVAPILYGFRSFDRQWIIPDNRLLNRPNPTLWNTHSRGQVYLTAPHDRTPTSGPALTFTALVPDLHHYHGRGGRAFPLWANVTAREPNICPAILTRLGANFSSEREVTRTNRCKGFRKNCAASSSAFAMTDEGATDLDAGSERIE